MSKRSTHFNNSWLQKQECSAWLAEGRLSTEAKCLLCNAVFSIAGSGFSQVQQHAQSKKHVLATGACSSQSKLGFTSSGNVVIKAGSGRVMCHDDKVSRAEIVLLLCLVKHNYSFSSHSDLIDDLSYILPDSDTVRDMSLGSTKSSYSLANGLGPYFHDQLVKDIQREFYSLVVDETTTQQSKKQLDIIVRYWSLQYNKVAVRYLNSCFLGHATAEVICSSIVNTLSSEGLSLQKMIMFSSDGPNVNIAVKRKLDEQIKAAGGKQLVDIGFCNLHAVHNALHTGLAAVPSWCVDEFVQDVFYWFKNYPSRIDDYMRIVNAMTDDDITGTFMRFVDNRWLSIGPVIDRLLLHFGSIRDFFLKGKFDSTTRENARFKHICCQLQANKATLVQLHFVRSVTSDFERFLTMFQDASPLIHLLHDELTELLRRLLLRFVKAELVMDKTANGLIKVVEKQLKSEHYLTADAIDIGSAVRQVMMEIKADKSQLPAYKTHCMDIAKFMEKCVYYLVRKSPLSSVLLKNIACLSPLFRQQPAAVQMIMAVVDHLPYCSSANIKDNVLHQWQTYAADDIPDDFFIMNKGQNEDGTGYVKYRHVDDYWHRVLQLTDGRGEPKYPDLAVVIKMSLSLSHGQ